jgi:predicted HAD superfamily Cof-like phosphohydrolase
MSIGINVNKAKELHKEKIRVVRNTLLQAEDVTFMRAVEANDADAQTASATRKQQLRDATNVVDSTTVTATDVTGVTNELKAVWDADVLGENPLV